MRKVIGFVVVLVIVVGMRMKNSSDDSAEIKADMKQYMVSLPCYNDHAELIDRWFESHHFRAFDDAYDMGGRRTRATFDEGVYLKELFDKMILTARDNNKKDIVTCLQDARSDLLDTE